MTNGETTGSFLTEGVATVPRPKPYAVAYQLGGSGSDPMKKKIFEAMDDLVSGLSHDTSFKPMNTVRIVWSLHQTVDDLKKAICESMRSDSKNFGKQFVDRRLHLLVTEADTYAVHEPRKSVKRRG